MQTTLKNHLAGELLTTATCWKLMLAGGEVMGFTDYRPAAKGDDKMM